MSDPTLTPDDVLRRTTVYPWPWLVNREDIARQLLACREAFKAHWGVTHDVGHDGGPCSHCGAAPRDGRAHHPGCWILAARACLPEHQGGDH